ncbi:hypothetical protein JYU34_007739 [Plutella xylostella]|uniref:BTB domain-containing protein n=1 Tax=Plutella xylostella TaxID=51655 RepID=A0ABQ7QR80_PLUXY|nr:hypothetical protein JYU34_007739 [Plutella xylostella]
MKIAGRERKVNREEDSYARRIEASRHNSELSQVFQQRGSTTLRNIHDNYQVLIKPKLHRSNSLSDLTTNPSDYNFPAFVLFKHSGRGSWGERSGDSAATPRERRDQHPHMSWNVKSKKEKKKSVTSGTAGAKFANEYMRADTHISSCAENSSECSIDHLASRHGAAFPFQSTPSGNLKVQSNQVVFQSSTVGVLLADPSQAQVQVKFQGNSGVEPGDLGQNLNDLNMESQMIYGSRDLSSQVYHLKTTVERPARPPGKDRDLESLGYGAGAAVDWRHVTLPKKQDLVQEFIRRIHNYVNTDTVVHIGDEQFHCHHVVLEVYSTFFHMNPHREVELPVNSVSPEAFQTLYEWMIFSGQDSNKTLKRENVISLFCAAQYLSVKDLEEQCWAFIVNEDIFTEDTAFNLYREAKARGLSSIVDLMVPRIMRFFLPLVASTDFLSLELEELLTFLKSNYICVTSEIEVLMAGVRWLHGDWAERRALAVDVMRCVRFGLISPWQLVDIKRNPDNAEILEIVNDPEVQHMVDDGLAYVIIKYWYGNNSKNYYHWIDVLGLSEPAERNWIGEEKNHVTYKDFLKYLDQFLVPKEQMFEYMASMPLSRRDDIPGTMRGTDDNTDSRRSKFDFPLPQTLRAFTGDGKGLPNMNEFFECKPKDHKKSAEHQRSSNPEQRRQTFQIAHCTEGPSKKLNMQIFKNSQLHDPPERDSEEARTTNSETSTDTGDRRMEYGQERRHSVAASYLAAATAALAGTKATSNAPISPTKPHTYPSRQEHSKPGPKGRLQSPSISLFHESKDSVYRNNCNKLSTSALGPPNKNYVTPGSLFHWDRETVLVFGGIDPHTTYGTGRNTGKDIFRFDPVTNVWDCVGELPEPRHHHSVAFLRGRVYLVGGADPRDDDVRGKSAVVATAWSLEPASRAWYSEAGLATPRKTFALVAHKMALYAIGGQDKKGRVLRSVERFDPKAGAWSPVRSMQTARMAAAATKYRDYIWVAGGMTGEKKRPLCSVVECYNSNTNEWTEIHHLRFPRCFATLFSMNDKLYLVGGAGRLSEKEKSASSVGAVDAWDWAAREWRPHTELSIPRHGHALAYLGTQLIVIGGVTTIYMRALNNVESYCCERGAWIRGVAALPSPLSGHGAVTLPPASLM